VTLNSGTTVSLNSYCKGSVAYPISWNCGTTTVSSSNTFSITANTSCTATCTSSGNSEQGGGTGGDSENDTTNLIWDSIVFD
jgi:hypothetical protein